MFAILANQAAIRGLREELGIMVEPAQVSNPLTAPHLRSLEVSGRFWDVEFVQSFRLFSLNKLCLASHPIFLSGVMMQPKGQVVGSFPNDMTPPCFAVS